MKFSLIAEVIYKKGRHLDDRMLDQVDGHLLKALEILDIFGRNWKAETGNPLPNKSVGLFHLNPAKVFSTTRDGIKLALVNIVKVDDAVGVLRAEDWPAAASIKE